ncbi:hypothetical protein LTR37_014413 [Vermiconidia calcicola]|uniref:Uncharacterized protein n=1 Tax=Vermiconidia calcicola TaxID=1690605 RepID=A0ACC3MTR0_9PEZI|nr:hypothetical protein LTR37_014413 [Vermiconidia calcicola]
MAIAADRTIVVLRPVGTVRILRALHHNGGAQYRHRNHQRHADDGDNYIHGINNDADNGDHYFHRINNDYGLRRNSVYYSAYASTTNDVAFQKRSAAPTFVLLALPLQISASATTTAAAHLLAARATKGTPTGSPGLSCGTVITIGSTTTVSTTLTFTASTTTTISTTLTSTTSTTTTTTSTSTTTLPAATATVGVAGAIYSKAYERTDTNTCFYSGSFFQQVGISNEYVQ